MFEGIFQGKYNDGLAVLPLTLVYCIWFGLAVVAQNYLWVAEKGSWAAIAMGIGLGANIVLNMLLIPPYGLEGAVIATTLGNASNLIVVYLFNNSQGCKIDFGMWLVSAMPLLLILPLPVAALAFVAVAVATVMTEFVFTAEEKSDVIGMVSKLRK